MIKVHAAIIEEDGAIRYVCSSAQRSINPIPWLVPELFLLEDDHERCQTCVKILATSQKSK